MTLFAKFKVFYCTVSLKGNLLSTLLLLAPLKVQLHLMHIKGVYKHLWKIKFKPTMKTVHIIYVRIKRITLFVVNNQTLIIT